MELRRGAAGLLQRNLNSHVRHNPGHGPIEPPTSRSLPAARHPAARARGREDQDSIRSLQHAPASNIPQLQPLKVTQPLKVSSNVIDIGPEGRWLLVCAGPRQHPPILCQFDVCSAKSDREVFASLKEFYTNMKGRLIHHVSMRTVRSIRFVQVRLGCRALTRRRYKTLTLSHSSNYISKTSSTSAKCPICHLNLEKMSICTSPAISYRQWVSI